MWLFLHHQGDPGLPGKAGERGLRVRLAGRSKGVVHGMMGNSGMVLEVIGNLGSMGGHGKPAEYQEGLSQTNCSSQGAPGARGPVGEKGDQGDPGEDGRNVSPNPDP